MINEKYSRWTMALLIFGFGMFFLGLIVYYIAFLPVPTPIQPLKVRIITWLNLEEQKNEDEIDIEEGMEEIEFIDEEVN
ncbi:MAG: hypothetical protein PF549_00075 [Patescibacteria group bacterium]|jgi:hypothetical protein|nr:hypothetical protein [Patescibacteria group bacterium]